MTKQPFQKLLSFNHIHFLGCMFLLFMLLILLQFGGLAASAMIPRSSIQHHLEESAELLNEHPVFFYLSDNPASRIDRYADSILLNIAYYYDAEHPIASVLRSSYYYTAIANENANLQYALTHTVEPTLDYSRYWHGSIVLIRPLLLLLNLKQIYILLAVVLLLLIGGLMYCLIRYRYGYSTVICLLLGLVMVSVWYVPFSLEYVWTVLFMLLACIFVVFFYQYGSRCLLMLMLIFGSLTAYFDFLTTETLTLLPPLALILIKAYQPDTDHTAGASLRMRSLRDGFAFILPCCLVWGLAYACTWFMKWGLGSIILHENLFASAFSQASLRLQGTVELSDEVAVQGPVMLLHAVFRNLYHLFPFSYLGQHAVWVLCLVLFVILFFYYMTRRGGGINPLPFLLILLAGIPLIRYMALANHSYIHCFFTYRALFASVFCISNAVCQGVDTSRLTKEWRKLWKPAKTRTAKKSKSAKTRRS